VVLKNHRVNGLLLKRSRPMEVGASLFLFQGLVFTLDPHFSGKEKAKLTELITSHAGIVSSLTIKTTHLIASHETSEKVAYCWRTYPHVLIVSSQFIIASIEAQAKQEVWKYSIFSRHILRDLASAETCVIRCLGQALTLVAHIREAIPDYPLLVLPQLVILTDTMKDTVLDIYQSPVSESEPKIEVDPNPVETVITEEEKEAPLPIKKKKVIKRVIKKIRKNLVTGETRIVERTETILSPEEAQHETERKEQFELLKKKEAEQEKKRRF